MFINSYSVAIGYGDDDDSEYDQAMEGTPGAGGGTNGGGRQSKAKVVLNPTEGFHHSDVYFEPPPEEANVVERILSIRTRQPQTDEERKKHNGDEVEEFYVKYKNYSYLHAEWCTFDKLMAGDKRFDGKVKRFKVKQATMMANVDDELFNPEYTMADRVLDVATQVQPWACTVVLLVRCNYMEVLLYCTIHGIKKCIKFSARY